MNSWNNKKIPFWQNLSTFVDKFKIIISEKDEYRSGWPESYKPSMSNLIKELQLSKTSYILVHKKDNNSISIKLLSGKIIVKSTLYYDKRIIFLTKNTGLEFATNVKKTAFIRYGTKINHGGIFLYTGRQYNDLFDENHNIEYQSKIIGFTNMIEKNNQKKDKNKKIIEEDTEEFTESESSLIEETLETLELYINKEYEIEDLKAKQEKPFVYFKLKAEEIPSNYKYYYRISLLEDDIKRLRELNPNMLKIKLTDENYMDLEIFNIKPDNSANDIIVTTAIQTDKSMLDDQNELYIAAIPTLQKVRQKVIDDLRSKKSPNKWLIPLASNVYSYINTIREYVPEYGEGYPLLPAQREGVEKGAGSKDITLVLGPPGTGKTTVILSWVKYFASKGMKVLVTSQNNKAVDNVLERLAKEKDLECLRVGNESKVSSSIHDLLIENYALTAQSKLIENLSDRMKSLLKSNKYLNDVEIYLKDQLKYNNQEQRYIALIDDNKKTLLELEQSLNIKKEEFNILNKDYLYLKELRKVLKSKKRNIQLKANITKLEKEQNEIINLINKLNQELKSKNKLIPLLKEDIQYLNKKVNDYENSTGFGKFFYFVPNKLNNSKQNSKEKELTYILSRLNEIKDEIGSNEIKKDDSTKNLEKSRVELLNFETNLHVFNYELTLDNCQLRYSEYFKKVGFLQKDNLGEMIINTESFNKEKELKIDKISLELEQESIKFNNSIEKLKTINQNYNEFKKSKPILPEYVPCEYVEDYNFKNINSTNEYCNNLLIETKKYKSTYNDLIKVIAEWEENMKTERQSSLYETILEYVDVVGATCIGINSNRLFANIPFDVVIVDESGQIQLHNLMVPLSRAQKAILVGDHMQLPPVVDDELCEEIDEEGYESIFLQKSWFEILWDNMPNDHKTMLDTQFRCPAIISDFVSKAFYNNEYFAGKGMELKKPIWDVFKSTMVFFDTSKVNNNEESSRLTEGRTEILGNDVETEVIIKTLMSFINKFPYLSAENEIGIIVPYKNHVLQVKKYIKKKKLDIGNLNVEDLVASVDSYQGQERDVIIFAFSRSNKKGNIGFLADWRRLNVAMTRTKKQLIMIGNLNTLTKDNKKAHEEPFKKAMRLLKSDLIESNSLIDARKMVRR